MMRLMSTRPTPPEILPDAPSVAALIVARDAEMLSACLTAIDEQVYGPDRVFIVGGNEDVRKLAGDKEALWRPNLEGVGKAIGEATFVWLLDERSRPRPGALISLIRDGSRVEASVVGSKVLDADESEELVSVGFATDVFGSPYSGLQEGELDQSQYDVIRDVAAVSAASMLIRRDLFFGLGGIDTSLGSASASIDFCQRARLRGGRVVVTPASIVHYQGPDPSPGWREQAGELRAMLKAYSLITLLWAVPLAFIVGAIEAVVAPFLRRWRLFGFIAAWLWNLVMLPSTIAARLRARRGRAAGDEELFRYQVNGSARLRALYDALLERLRQRFPEGVLAGFSDVVETGTQTVRRPAFVVGFLSLVVSALATRDIWSDALPAVGFSLPPPESASATLAAYAGGWNPAGFGSPEVLRPDIGAIALVQTVFFGNGGLAVALITFGAFVAGIFGMARLLRVWGITSVPGYLAGLVLVAGPAVVALGDASHWAALIAVGVLPWPALLSLRPWPATWSQRIGRIAAIVLTSGIVAVFAPAAAAVPALAVVLWTLLGTGTRWWAALRALAGLALALPLLMPWIMYEDFASFFTEGDAAFWQVPWGAVVVAVFAVIGALLGGDRKMVSVTGWGGLLTVVGAAVARAGDLGLGRESFIGGLILSALGLAVVVGAALETFVRRKDQMGAQRWSAVVGAVGALALVAGTAFLVGPGRNGLPIDSYTGEFTFAADDGEATSRVLMFGAAEDLPGTSRDLDGLGYRVFIPPVPENWTAYLNDARLGDEALADYLNLLLDGEIRRAGEGLAEFGIGWVAFTDQSPLEAIFETQLDLLPLRSFDFPVFRNEVPAPVARDANGVAWTVDGTGYTRPIASSSVSVSVSVNADERWGPGTWAQDDWGNRVITEGDDIGFGGYEPRRTMAIGAISWLGLLLLLAGIGWWRSRA